MTETTEEQPIAKRPTSRLRRVVFRLVTVLASILLTLVVCEIVLWSIDYSYSPMEIEIEGDQLDWRRFHCFEDDHFEYDPDTFWTPKQKRFPFNAQGLRGKMLVKEKGQKEYRVLAIGDSNTLGWAGENDNSNWPAFLEKEFADSDKDVVVVNGGVWGYASYQGLQRFKKLIRYAPDMVLVSFGSNDALLVDRSDADFAESVIHFPLFNTRCGQLFVAARESLSAMGKKPTKDNMVFRVSVEEYKQNLAEIARIAEENGATCVFLTRPFIGESRHELWWKNFGPEYVEATLEIGKELGVPVVDVYAEFKDKEDLFADESHFTSEGHQKAAAFIHDKIKQLVK